MLGGSSSLNYLFYVRGDSQDFDNWERLGHKGWSYKDVLPFFLKSERQLSPLKDNQDTHSGSGNHHVRDSIYFSPLKAAYEAMAKRHGYHQTDINDGSIEGFELPQLNIDENGRRSDTYSAYLKDVNRDNLTIITNAQVLRIIFNKHKKAEGVQVEWFGKHYFVKATKEVIVSSGAVGSPHLLLHSGIGPKEDLQALDVG